MSTAIQYPANERPAFSSESLDNNQAIQTFWHGVEQGKLAVTETVTLAYCAAKHPTSTKAIIISSGRVEAYQKYQELIFDLYGLGYSVYAVDHRGQGLSSRLTENPQQGHVTQFADYVSDFGYFVDKVVRPQGHDALYLVGHSMGGTIATLYLKHAPEMFKAAVFSAPMYGICLPMNKRFVRWLAERLDNGSQSTPNYVLGGKDYCPVAFKDNDLTHSPVRYDHYRRLYEQHPELKLGSPTNRWLTESLDACELAIDTAKSVGTPILILQADEDTIVENEAQDSTQGDNCRVLSIANARHEIFMERDEARNQALSALAAFLESHA